QAPERELKRLQTVSDCARLHTAAAGTDAGAAEEVHAASVRFVDDAVGGLLRYARAAVDSDHRIVGVAWGAPVDRVEVKIDSGQWVEATIDHSEEAEFA